MRVGTAAAGSRVVGQVRACGGGDGWRPDVRCADETDTGRDHVVAVIALGVGIAGTGIYLTVTDETTSPTSSPSQAPAPEPPAEPAPADPYEVYLDLAPAGEVELSREGAQTRAMRGCGQTWAPGTVDAALAKARAELCADMVERTG